MLDTVLDVDDLRVRFGHREILRGISFSLRRGEALGIMGGNASGKSTTLKAVLGIVPHSGSVRWHVDMKKVAYVPQRPALYLDFTVAENIRAFSRISPVETVDVVDIIDYFDLKRYLNVPVRRLSGGYQKIVNLVISLLVDPEVLVLDEPTAELDYKMRMRLMNFLSEFKEAGRSILVVTHVPGEADEVCDRVIVLHRGNVVVDGTPEEILQKMRIPYVVKLYGKFVTPIPAVVLNNAEIRSVTPELVEIEIEPERFREGMMEVLHFSEEIGARRVYVEEPDIIRAIEMGVWEQ